ncbi:MAG: endonuclease III [Candidatus Omnitrophota bacterium]
MKIGNIIRLLDKAYGKPARSKRSDPVDELVRTILSQNTTDRNSLKAFASLKERFRSWGTLLKTPVGRIERIIKHAGLANIKSKRIKETLYEINRRQGGVTLAHLADLSVDDAAEYLKSLKGVGPKTAACVLLFSFGMASMPVDTHIFRVAKRLGLIGASINIGEAHDVLSDVVPKDLIYSFHLGIIEHGRRTCKARSPRCGSCVLYGLCAFKDKRFYAKKGAELT